MSAPAIGADGLSKSFGEVVALDGLSFRVPAGSVLGLLGPNGSGKTTTVSILSTALRPDAGRATIGGLDVAADPAGVRRVIGFAGPSVAEAAYSVLTAGGYQPERDGAGVRVRSAAGSAALIGVLRALEGLASDPVSVALREPTLDDVFRSLTEGEG